MLLINFPFCSQILTFLPIPIRVFFFQKRFWVTELGMLSSSLEETKVERRPEMHANTRFYRFLLDNYFMDDINLFCYYMPINVGGGELGGKMLKE